MGFRMDIGAVLHLAQDILKGSVSNFNPPEFDCCTLGECCGSLREARPRILGDYQNVALGQLNIDPIRNHLLSEEGAYYGCCVGVANPGSESVFEEEASLL